MRMKCKVESWTTRFCFAAKDVVGTVENSHGYDSNDSLACVLESGSPM